MRVFTRLPPFIPHWGADLTEADLAPTLSVDVRRRPAGPHHIEVQGRGCREIIYLVHPQRARQLLMMRVYFWALPAVLPMRPALLL